MLRSLFKSFRANSKNLRRFVHNSASKKSADQNSGLRKVLYDLKASASDEELRKNIVEFETKLKELQESEKMRNISGALSKGMVLSFFNERVIFQPEIKH
jgi:hypothetical protein